MSQQWFYSKDGKSRVGPVSSGELQALTKSGRLLPNHMVWTQGMAEWTPARVIKGLFGNLQSMATPPVAPRPAYGPAPALKRADIEPPEATVVTGNAKTGWQQLLPSTKIALIAGGAVLALLLGFGIVALMKRDSRGSSSGAGAGPDWGSPVRVSNRGHRTNFEVGLKDAWRTDYAVFGGIEQGKKAFFVVYYYKNLGPREGSFSLGDVEVKTSKGHMFRGHDFSSIESRLWGGSKHQLAGCWTPKQTDKIEETGESGIVFYIPTDEDPTELIAKGGNFKVKLPQRDFEFRRYSETFGFLPYPPEKAVPGLIEALDAKRRGLLGGEERDGATRGAAMQELAKIGPGAKPAVPALINVFLRDEYMDVRAQAAKTLGEIGPAAKEAIPALRNPMQVSRPQFGGFYERDLMSACFNAIQKIQADEGKQPSKVPAPKQRGPKAQPGRRFRPRPQPPSPPVPGSG